MACCDITMDWKERREELYRLLGTISGSHESPVKMAEVAGVIFHRKESPWSPQRWRLEAASIFTIMRVKNCRDEEQVRRQRKEGGGRGEEGRGEERKGRRMKEDAKSV